ncbi:hypothetical protein ACF0H5_006439 [Mactra antiquata]
MPQSHKTLEEVRRAALVAERCVASDTKTSTTDFTEKVCEQVIAALTTRVSAQTLNMQQPYGNIQPQYEQYQGGHNHPPYISDLQNRGRRNANRQYGNRRQNRTEQPGPCGFCGGRACYNISQCPARDV